jgi:uncharacterized protein (TIGR03435 family)
LLCVSKFFLLVVMQSQIAGAPAWVKSDRYDMAAKAESDPPVDGIRAMLWRLLEERFQLKSHWETQEGAVYDLVVSKPGKLKETSADCPGILSDRTLRTNAPPDDAPCGSLRNTPGHTKGYRLTAEQLAESLSFFMPEARGGYDGFERQVRHRTGVDARGNPDADARSRDRGSALDFHGAAGATRPQAGIGQGSGANAGRRPRRQAFRKLTEIWLRTKGPPKMYARAWVPWLLKV